jgi:hypothetical protein
MWLILRGWIVTTATFDTKSTRIPIYHPTVVREEFLRQTGVMIDFRADDQQRT